VLIIKELVVGPLMANCFIFGCVETKEAVVIDPGGDADRILLSLADSELKVKYIINTHGHFDHVSANGKIKDATGADILIHPLDAPMLGMLSSNAAVFGISVENSPPCDQTIEEGDTVSFGKITLKVIHTPGHTPGGISLYTDKIVWGAFHCIQIKSFLWEIRFLPVPSGVPIFPAEILTPLYQALRPNFSKWTMI
jgi:glyoxylase-like metal-dependent hydrolase (beta-lactamase superfamily II)